MGNCFLIFQIGRELNQHQKWRIMVDAHPDQRFKLFMDDQYKGLRNLLDKIPNDIIIKTTQKICTNLFVMEKRSNFNYKNNFANWAQTHQSICDDILYPSQLPARQKTQIDAISKFIQQAVKQGKRIRGCGTRHSWGNIFSDPQQRLVAFYPYKVAKGTSRQVEQWAAKMDQMDQSLQKDNIEHLNSIRKVGEYQNQTKNGKITKHLVKIGAGVSNEQLRKWCIRNGYQCKSNVIMVEINVCGALGTCSHGSGKDSQTLADYVNEIQFIDVNGKRQKLSKKDHPSLIKSAASALGLLGLIIFVTLELDQLQIVQPEPRKQYKDYVIPYPKGYPQEKKRMRQQRQEYKSYVDSSQPTPNSSNWEKNLCKFKQAVNKTYNQWFYFPSQGSHVFENTWQIFGKKTAQNLQKIYKESQGVFVQDYPLPAIKYFSEFALLAGNLFMNSSLTQSTVAVFMRNPYLFFPSNDIYINYPDAVHFQRGIHNLKVRDFQCEIEVSGQIEPDYDLIQWLWWDTLEIVEENSDIINIGLEMRIFKGSQATLAPQHQMDFVCSIQILRSLNLNEQEEKAWAGIINKVFNTWKNRIEGKKNSKGKPLNILPHWGKEWDFHPQIKAHVMGNEQMRSSMRKFLKDYKQIAKIKGFDYQRSLQTFSNKVYRQLINNAVQSPQDRIL